MNDLNKSLKLKKQAGISLVPVIIGIAVFSLSTVMFLNQGGGLFQSSRMDAATTEIAKLVRAIELFKATNPGYTVNAATGAVAITIPVLANNGFGIDPINTGVGDNAYGLNTVVAPTGGATTATLTYSFDTQESCNQARIRFVGTSGISTAAAPACGGANNNDLALVIN